MKWTYLTLTHCIAVAKLLKTQFVPVAQGIERLPSKQRVAGSNPAWDAISKQTFSFLYNLAAILRRDNPVGEYKPQGIRIAGIQMLEQAHYFLQIWSEPAALAPWRLLGYLFGGSWQDIQSSNRG